MFRNKIKLSKFNSNRFVITFFLIIVLASAASILAKKSFLTPVLIAFLIATLLIIAYKESLNRDIINNIFAFFFIGILIILLIEFSPAFSDRKNLLIFYYQFYDLFILLGLLLAVGAWFISSAKFEPPANKPVMNNRLTGILLVIIIIAAAALRILFMPVSFREDEFLHLGAAVGFLKTGKLVLWDLLRNVPTVHEVTGQYYTRGLPITLQAAFLFRLFGISETVGRIVPLFWGLLTLPVAYWFSNYFTKSRTISLFLVLLLAVHPLFYSSSRYLRMYSMFVPLYLIFLVITHKALEEKTNKKYAMLSLILLGFTALYVHVLVLISLLGISIYCIYRLLEQYNKTKNLKNRYAYTIVSFVTVSLFSLQFAFRNPVRFLKSNITFVQIKVEYLGYTFEIFPLLAALVLFGLGVAYARGNKRLLFLTATVLGTFYFLIFWSQRYTGGYYIINLLPAVYVLVLLGLKTVWQRGRAGRLIVIIFSSVTLLNIGTWYFNYFSAKTYAKPDFKQAYSYVNANSDSDTGVLILQPRTFYLKDFPYFKRLEYQPLPAEKRMSLEQFKLSASQNRKNFIIFQSGKEWHFRYEVRRYIIENFKYERAISQQTGMMVYYKAI